MSIIGTIVGGVVLLLVAFFGLQLFMVRRMQRMKGRPAPTLSGKPGRRIGKGRPALFYFYSPQCGACRTMTPVVQGMANRNDGVFAVDISRDMDTARQFGVMATPTTIFVDKGNIMDVLVGPQSEDRLRALMASA